MHFPLEIVNGFIPDGIVALDGDLDGSLNLPGPLSQPIFTGNLRFDSASVYSDLYSVRFRLDSRPFSITDSRLIFDKFPLYAKSSNPLLVNGFIDFSNFDRMTTDIQMYANDYELLNAKRNKVSLLYGKVFVDFNATMRGSLQNPVIRGNINVLGKTDVAYILKDSPLSVDDQLSSLVTFVDFSDTTSVDKRSQVVDLGGLNMVLNIQIAPGAQARVDLNDDGSNYVELEGGGNLSMQINPQGDFLLT